MAKPQGSKNKNSIKHLNTDQNLSGHSLDSGDTSVCKYQNDKDFDEAFKNLLRPIESITKKNHCEPLQYNLLKELDSYLNHLKESSEGGYLIFVEAALMIQNVILIYQKRVDQLVDVMMKLIGKFRAYRRNQNDDENMDDVENEEGNKKKKKEKKVKLYPSFEPIKGQIFGTLKIYDCKLINLSKKTLIPKVVLNANIKVDNKYSQLLPYILIGNGENIGKKYDFMVNSPLNRDLAVNEEFDCPTIDDNKNDSPLKYRNNNDPLPTNFMDVDGADPDNDFPSTPDPVVFDQTVIDEYNPICSTAVEPLCTARVLNTSQIPQIPDDNAWQTVSNDNLYPDKPITNKKMSKREDSGQWLPAYTVGELRCQLIKLKSGISVDSAFRKLIHEAQEAQRSEVSKIRMKRIIAEDKKRFDYYDEEFDEKLKNGEEPGFKGFASPVYNGDVDLNFNDNYDDQDQLLGDNADNFQSYQQNAINMQKHEQNQIEIMNEQLEMRKRVQIWHDNLRPILEEEEKKTEYDVHEYGTRLLNCFNEIGEQKLFDELVNGLEQEEVARYYLATIMMANTYNLKITKAMEDCNSKMKIELLKKERHHEQLQVNIGNQVNQELN